MQNNHLNPNTIANTLASAINSLNLNINLNHCQLHDQDDNYIIPMDQNHKPISNQLFIAIGFYYMHTMHLTEPYYISIAKQLDNSAPHIYIEPANTYTNEDLAGQTPMPLNLGLSFPISLIFI